MTKDLFESARWFGAAAKHGHTESCFELGEIFRKGNGESIEVNMLLAHKYLRKAEDQGHAEAIERMTEIRRDRRKCHCCGAEDATRLCERCREARYCGPECQRKHWHGEDGGRGDGAGQDEHRRTCRRTQ